MGLVSAAIPTELLAELLDLPEGARVIRARADFPTSRHVHFTLEVPEAENGAVGLKYQRDEMQILSLVAIEPGATTEEIE